MFPSVSFFPELFESQLVGLPVTPLLDLEADTGVSVSNVDKVDVWADQSGNGFNFTQSGTARPAFATIGGYPCLQFDGVDDWMLGQNWAALDNMSSFSFVCIALFGGDTPEEDYILTKCIDDGCTDSPGWMYHCGALGVQKDFSNFTAQYPVFSLNNFNQKLLFQADFLAPAAAVRIYRNGILSERFPGGWITGSGATNYSTSQPVRMGIDDGTGVCNYFSRSDMYAIRIYSPALNDMQRGAVEQELANRYGVVL